MIFSPPMARAIAAGRKTQTRRPVKGDQPSRYHAGRSYAVQPGRGKPSDGVRLVVTDVRTELAGALTFPDALAEGFKTTGEWKAYFVRLHDKAWIDRQEEAAARAVGAVIDGPGVYEIPPVSEAELVARFDARHADRLVWVITFHLDRTHRPRLLAARSDELYTEDPRHALAEEPEAVDAATLAYFTADAAERRLGQPGRREEALRRRAKSLATRLRQESVAASRQGADVTAVLDQIEQALAQLGRLREAA